MLWIWNKCSRRTLCQWVSQQRFLFSFKPKTIEIEEEIVWDRERDDGFPSIKDLKQKVRDSVAPDRNMGHIDDSPSSESIVDMEIDDEDAEEMRRFYGVLWIEFIHVHNKNYYLN